MPSFAHRCPYCDTVSAAFSGVHFIREKPDAHFYDLFVQCGVCGRAAVARYNDVSFGEWIAGRKSEANLVMFLPVKRDLTAPKHVPSNIERFYLQAEDAFRRSNWDSAGTMFRKALDVGLKALHSGGSGTLFQRIERLPPEKGVTPSMKKWAHQIRTLGNDAAHEDVPFEQMDATDLRSFTELFLTYAFTLPGLLSERASI